MSDNKIIETLDANKHVTPYLEKWLKKKHWTAKQGLLLLTGNDPLYSNGIDWQPSEGLYCKVNQIARLGWQDDPHSDCELRTEAELEEEIRDCNKDAQREYNDRYERVLKAHHQVQQVPVHELPTFAECRDNDRHGPCVKIQKYRRKSGRLLSKFIEHWSDLHQGLDDKAIEVPIYLRWVFNTCLCEAVPWWREAILKGLIKAAELEHATVETVVPEANVPATNNNLQDDVIDQLRDVLVNNFERLENFSVTQLRKNGEDSDKKIEDLSKQIIDDLIQEIGVYKDAESILEETSKLRESKQQILIKNHLKKTTTLKKNISKLESDLRRDNLKEQADLLSPPVYYLGRIEKGLSAKIHRKIKVATHRKSLREDLAVRLFTVFSKYGIEVSPTIYDEEESFTIFIISEIFYVLFDRKHSEPGSIKNMILKLKKERLDGQVELIEGIISSMIADGNIDQIESDHIKEHLKKDLKRNPF